MAFLADQLLVQGCAAPQVERAAAAPCAEGDFILEDQACTAQCQEGFVPSSERLLCHQEALVPSTFECLPGCSLTDLPRGGSCLEGTQDVAHGTACTTQCGSGYGPNVAQLLCQRGILSPPTFLCELFCPAVLGSGGFCAEGAFIASKGVCTASCGEGYLPSVAQLSCLDGAFSPGGFQCERVRPCFLSSASFAESPPCLEGYTLQHNSSCTASCLPGYVPNFASLYCWDGALTRGDKSLTPVKPAMPKVYVGTSDFHFESNLPSGSMGSVCLQNWVGHM
ncbi:unnamed protein product [Effrenium voratum]|nr:unnamed protein product [Effrenium voratum]